MPPTIAREEDLYELWERYAGPGVGFRAVGGSRVVVVAPGVRNAASGPDYLGAVLIIDGATAVGPVEMHRVESEWFAHGHQHDRAYDGVILHVVGTADAAGRLSIPTVDAAGITAASNAAVGGDGSREKGLADVAPDRITPDLVAELAWARLLRRVTEIIRSRDVREGDMEQWGGGLRRAFVARMFDALGYAANRAPMGAVARALLDREGRLPESTFEEIAAVVFGAAGLDRERVVAAGSSFMNESRLRNILKNCDLPPQIADWSYDTRPANAPERRLWGAAKLVFDIYHDDLLLRLCDGVEARAFASIAGLLTVRMGGRAFIGIDRAREIAINALLPAALAAGIAARRSPLIEGACRLYREAPSLGANRIVRRMEERFLDGVRLEGAFWQQGAIEFHQRYLLPDRSGLSFVAEHGGMDGPGLE